MTFEEKYNLVSDDFKTAREIGLAPATLGAMARRGYIEVKEGSPKQYRKTKNVGVKLILLLEQNKDDYETYFTLRKSNEKLGMLCSLSNNTIMDCFDKPYDLSNVCLLELRTKKIEIST